MRLSALHVYPIKSFPGVALDRGEIRPAGLRHDRRWMVADEHGEFISQRSEPRLLEAELALADDGYRLTLPVGSLHLPETIDGPLVSARVWRSDFEAIVHPEGSALVSEWLGRPLQLMHLPDHVVRPAGRKAPAGSRVSMADGQPYLLIGEASLADLVARAGSPLSMARFRPNLVVADSDPYAEDGWSRVRIGDRSFTVVEPCERCVMTTIDPATGERGPEPLRTLATYRRGAKGVEFGVYVVPEQPGPIEVGQTVVPVST